MNYYKHIIFICLLIFLFAIKTSALKDCKISNVDFNFVNEKVVITYNIEDFNHNDYFKISLQIFNKDNQKINAVSLSGDIGDSINGGIGKKIIWDSRKDGYILDEKIYISINATKKPNIPTGRHLIYSGIMPGLGDYRLSNGNFHFVYGLAAYGSVASAVGFNWRANSTYDRYKDLYDIDKRNNEYKKFKTEKTISYILAGTAVALWTYKFIRVMHKAHKLKQEITLERSRYYYDLSQKPINSENKAKYINTKIPYDFAVEKGDNLLKEEKYYEAKSSYIEAKKLSPNEKYPPNKIEEINKILADIKAKDELYAKTIVQADLLFNNKNLEQAKIEYQKALNLKPKEEYPKNKILELNKLIEEKRINDKYNDLIAQADQKFKNKNYEEAKKVYSEASGLKPSENYPKDKITETEKILENIEQQLINKEYNNLVVKADVAFAKGDYDNAINYYKDAQNVKSDMTYPEKKIKEIELILKSKEAIKIPLIKNGNVYEIEVLLNDIISYEFTLDTGADDIFVTPDIFITLYRKKTIKDSDILGDGKYRQADGSIVDGTRFIIRKIKIGDIIIRDVNASVSNTIKSGLLLGGTVFKKLGKISIDYNNDLLIIEK